MEKDTGLIFHIVDNLKIRSVHVNFLVLSLIWTDQMGQKRECEGRLGLEVRNGLVGMKPGRQRGFGWCFRMCFLVLSFVVRR